MASQAQKELQACQRMCEELKEKLGNLKRGTSSRLLTEMAGDVETKSSGPKEQRICGGHFGKIYALHWGSDSLHIVTASQDGKLIIWNAVTGNKQLAITLNSAWVMTCAFSSSFDYVASGGLDNTVSIFRTTQKDPNGPNSGKFKSKDLYKELEKHDGYLSCARFVNGREFEILSSSGDGTCILWDIENKTAKSVFADHTGDVMCVSLNKKNPDLFVSGSVDTTAKVWDMRQGERCVINFAAHEADVNTVQWFADSTCVITGSDDGSVRLFDMRSYRQLNHYIDKNCKSLHSDSPAGVTSVDVSKTGQYVFSAYDNGHVYMWSTLKGVNLADLEHESRVSCLGISDNGYGLATGCWDFNLKIFA